DQGGQPGEPAAPALVDRLERVDVVYLQQGDPDTRGRGAGPPGPGGGATGDRGAAHAVSSRTATSSRRGRVEPVTVACPARGDLSAGRHHPAAAALTPRGCARSDPGDGPGARPGSGRPARRRRRGSTPRTGCRGRRRA